MSDTNPAGWQPDPTARHEHRYWDGTTWTDNVSDAGVAATDPFVAAGGDPTAAWSTTPGAPTPPVPQPASASSGSDGGSKKGLLIGGGILALVIILVIAALAFNGDDKISSEATSSNPTTTTQASPTDGVRSDLVGLLTSDSGLSQKDAECAADVIIDEIGVDRLEGVDFGADAPPAGLDAAFSAATIKALRECSLDFNGSEATSSTEGSGGGSTDLPADFEKLLADTYEGTFGLSRQKAECLATKLSDSIKSGELSENQAASAVFDYLADCNISLDEFGTN